MAPRLAEATVIGYLERPILCQQALYAGIDRVVGQYALDEDDHHRHDNTNDQRHRRSSL
jgi:hypothetical protein